MMAEAKPKKIDYQALNSELEAIMSELQREGLDIDEALKHFERGLVIVKQLEGYLQAAENRVVELKAKFKTKS